MRESESMKKLGVLSCGLAVGVMLVTPIAEANVLSDIRHSISSLWGKSAAHRQEAREARARASSTRAQAESVHDRLERTQQLLASATETYANYHNQLRRTEVQINQTRRDIDVTKKRYKKHQRQYADRLGAMQRYGQPTFMEVVFGSKSLSDLTQRTALFNAITDRDAELQSSLKADQQELQRQQNELASQWGERYSLAKKANGERVRVYNARYQQAQLWQKLNSSTYELLSYAAEQQRSSNEISGMIGDLQSRRNQIIAEYEAQAARERAQQRAVRRVEQSRPHLPRQARQLPAQGRQARYAPRLAPRVGLSRPQLAPMPVEVLKSTGAASVPDGEWTMPTRGRLSSRFGYRFHPVLRRRKLHTGEDIAAPSGTAFRAARSGRVLWAGWKKAYGNTIIVDNGNGVTTLYGHASKIGVRAGQPVKAGEYIGNVGSTGWSTGPHLHFEVRKDGKPVNPNNYVHKH